MKRNDEEFFEKYKFQLTLKKPHPVYKDEMTFEGLEADYVQRICSDLEYHKEAYIRLANKMDWMTTQEMHRLKDIIKAEESK